MKEQKLRRIAKAALISMVLAIGASCMTGCSGSNEAQHETYILYGAHANQPVIDETKFIDEITKACAISKNKIVLISIEGSPVVVETYSIPKSGFMLLPSQKKRRAKTYSTEILSDIAAITPTTAECDYAAAFNRIANNISPGTEVDIIVKGSGLSTQGIVDFTKGIIRREAESLVEAVEAANALPRFTDIQSVWWTGLGQTSSPQESVSENQYRRLEEFWTLYLEKGGAKDISISAGNSKSGSEAKAELPPVTPVDLPQEDSIEYDGESKLSINKGANVINEATLGGFLADSASFVDTNKATEVAKQIAPQLNNEKFIVAAFTAGDNNNQYCTELSKERAETFRNLLIDKGANKENLIALGCGCGIDSGFTVRGLGTGPEASVNRICVLVNANSETGRSLLAEYGD